MATVTTDIRIPERKPGLGARILSAFARAVEAQGRTVARRAEIEALEAKSDAELAAMGLRRQDIMRHVFRDLFYV